MVDDGWLLLLLSLLHGCRSVYPESIHRSSIQASFRKTVVWANGNFSALKFLICFAICGLIPLPWTSLYFTQIYACRWQNMAHVAKRIPYKCHTRPEETWVLTSKLELYYCTLKMAKMCQKDMFANRSGKPQRQNMSMDCFVFECTSAHWVT